MFRAVEFSHLLIRERLYPGDTAVDATAGNGHDTHFLAQLVGDDGMVFAFDVQQDALASARTRLERWGVPPQCFRFYQQGHETMREAIPAEFHGRIGAVLFNLGYLPGGDKTVVTRAETSLAALRASLELLRPGGVAVVVLYTGHPGGPEEACTIRDFASGLPPREYQVVEYATLNARQPAPAVLAIEKQGEIAEAEYII